MLCCTLTCPSFTNPCAHSLFSPLHHHPPLLVPPANYNYIYAFLQYPPGGLSLLQILIQEASQPFWAERSTMLLTSSTPSSNSKAKEEMKNTKYVTPSILQITKFGPRVAIFLRMCIP